MLLSQPAFMLAQI